MSMRFAEQVAGRSLECEAVGAFLDRAAQGPSAAVVEGEAGIGKTTIWLAAVKEARRRGFVVLTARPSVMEAHLAFVSLADLLYDVGEKDLDALPVPQRRAIDCVLLRGHGESDGPADERAAGAALMTLLERLARETAPVLLAVDDVQWVDSSSRRALAFALRRAFSPVALLATLRTGEGDDVAGWLQLPPPAPTSRIPLGPLSLGALHGVLAEQTGRSYPRPEMVRIRDVSGGNPFYALELARAGAPATGTLPPAVSSLVGARLDALDGPVRDVLLVVALLAEPTVPLLGRAMGGTADSVTAPLEAAERAGVLTLRGNRIAFAHPLLAAGVSAAADPAHRRALHRRLATIVADPERRARHLALAAVHADSETLAALDAAAASARARGATAAAAEFLTLAVELGGDSPGRQLRLARDHFDAGDPDRARRLLEVLVGELPPGVERAAVLRDLAVVRLHDDSYLEAAAHLDQAVAEVGDDVGLRARIMVDLSYVLANLGRIPDARASAPTLVALAERLGEPGVLAQALASRVIVGFLAGDGLDERGLERALALEDDAPPGLLMARPSLIHGLLLSWTGRLDAARDTLHAVRRRSIERGQESDLMFSVFHQVVLECWRGDLAAARLLAEDTDERARQLGTDIPRAVALSTGATVAAFAGDADEARRAARAALEIFQRGSCLAVTVWPVVTLGFVEVSAGDFAAAAAVLAPMISGAAAMGYGEPTAAPFAPDAVEALVGLGRLDEARILVDQLEANGRRLDRAWALACGGRGRALLCAAEGDLDAAAGAARTAMTEHDRLPMPLERGRTLLVLARVERRRRRRAAAAEALRAALELFDGVGAALWSAQTRAELDRVTVPRGTDGELTPAERRVADLAAVGMTNREVAAALFISPKTVEANLARVYHKLHIRSRAELGRLLADAHRETPDSSGGVRP